VGHRSHGGVEPCVSYQRAKKRWVLGLVTSKSGLLESKDALKRRIDVGAAKYAEEQLCLSPQCGVAYTARRNHLTKKAVAKLRTVVEAPYEVWAVKRKNHVEKTFVHALSYGYSGWSLLSICSARLYGTSN